MASITEIRSRMRSIEQTLKITNAMYLISSAKVKKARKQLSEVEPYFDRLARTILDIFRHSPELQHRFIEGHHKSREDRKTGFVVITGDKGLAGAYNHNVLKLAESYLERKKDSTLFLIGQMGRHYFEKKNIPIDGEFMYTAQDPTITRAREISNTLLNLYEDGALDEIYLVFTRSYSAMRMEPEIIKLLPLDRAMLSARRGLSEADQYRDVVRYEPSPEAVLDVLVPGLIKGYLFSALVESFCSEQNARMTAMDSASESAREMLKTLSLEFNRARQGAITQEITEIAGGAAGLTQL
ncbi:MAG TPA: ATP synthase F1 subunit gamma [Candidatus Acutalibacter pullicola]|uniref:ATP synthase gamma chain n=1 Tax=Candidatus Acutalibacter pullicola TaxID=2838417 RepID=A0A9D2SFC6_9FIRM|nr:ATP synthase F1 subunit gamma [Candidatus Acutalibacter pullicola]